jgi:hypothetical protein
MRNIFMSYREVNGENEFQRATTLHKIKQRMLCVQSIDGVIEYKRGRCIIETRMETLCYSP